MEATITSAAASAVVRRPRRAVQRTSAMAIGAAGSRYFGPSHGRTASSAAPTTALPSAGRSRTRSAHSAAPASAVPAAASG